MTEPLFYLDQLEIGREFVTESRTITAEDVAAFAHLTGDLNPVHLDEEAGRASHFGQRVAHGAFVLSVASGLMSPLLIPTTLAAYGIDQLRFRRPVYPGETVHAVMRVDGLKPLNDESGLLTLRCRVVKQSGEAAMLGTFTVIVRRHP